MEIIGGFTGCSKGKTNYVPVLIITIFNCRKITGVSTKSIRLSLTLTGNSVIFVMPSPTQSVMLEKYVVLPLSHVM